MHKNNKSNLRTAPSIDNAPLPLLNSPDYISSKPQLNHLFIDNEYFSEPWHGDQYMNLPEENEYRENWRLRDKMKTSGVILLVCLNIGVDPPDVTKPANCARKECWFDPNSVQKQKALEHVGTLLQQQYEKLHSKAKFKQCLDPTSHELERVCVNLRRQVRTDRLLIHYNGHGVPRPTKNGELWVFGKHYTHYMPVSLHDLRSWIGEPAIYVFDCSGAGALLPHCVATPPGSPHYYSEYDQERGESEILSVNFGKVLSPGKSRKSQTDSSPSYGESASFVLAACNCDESLPLNPQYPADIFTACLTTPIPIALRWFILQNPHLFSDINVELGDNLPGKDGDRKTPRGMLNWIFTAIADTIAWSSIPSGLFQKLFRQDLLVASLFRNFLLAKRIMRSFNCTPQSYPSLPDCSMHPLWQAWDAAVEHCLLWVHKMNTSPAESLTPPTLPINNSKNAQINQSAAGPIIQSPFFNEQLIAFEIWLDFGGPGGSYKHTKEPPVYLPILLQALLSHAHRLKALHLLRRFVALGPESVHSILAVGVFPYLLKLLHNPVVEIRNALMSIWTYVIGFDITCREELVKDIKEKNDSKFLLCLKSPDCPYQQRTMAAFIHSEICNKYRSGQELFLELGYNRVYSSLLSDPTIIAHTHLKKWVVLSLAKLCEDYIEAKNKCISCDIHLSLYPLLQESHPAVRIATIFALGNLLGASLSVCPSILQMGVALNSLQNTLRGKEIEIIMQILESFSDGCAAVRREAVFAVSKIFSLPVHLENLSHISTAVSAVLGESDSAGTIDDSLTPVSGSPARPTSKQFKRSTGSTPKRSGRSVPSASEQTSVTSWMMSSSQLANITQSLQRFLESRQIETLPTQTSTSLFREETSESLTPPSLYFQHIVPQGPEKLAGNNCYNSSLALASSYLQLWFTLLETQWTDPHPLVSKSAKYILGCAKIDSMSRTSQGEITENDGRKSDIAWEKPDLREVHSIRPHSHDQIRSTPPLPPKTPDLDGGRSPTRRPHDLSQIGLVSTTYEWNRKFFLRPDIGFDPVDDLLSAEGRERSTRLLMREEIKDLANRIDESFRPIQDAGLTTLLEKDSASAISLDGSHYSPSSQPGNQDLRQGMHAALLPSSLTKFESKGILRVENANLTSNAMFHAFHDILAVSDDKGVGIWSLENGNQIMHVKASTSDLYLETKNGKYSTGNTNIRSPLITSMTWVNESLDSLLLVGCDDGTVKIWRDVGDSIEESSKYSNEGYVSPETISRTGSGVVLSSAFKALPDITGGSVGSGMVLSWQQSSGLLSVGGNSGTIRLWDVSQEKCVTVFQTGVDTCLSSLVSQTASFQNNLVDSSWGAGIVKNGHTSMSTSLFAWSFAGFADGSIGIYDQRVDTRGGRVHLAKEHNSWIVSAHLRADIPEVVTGAMSGGVKFWDIRTMRSYKTIEVHKSPLTALTIHNCAPIMATGSQAQFIKILTLAGDQLGMIRYHDGFMGNRIGPVSCLAFHPVRMLMAAGSTDNLVSIYSIPDGYTMRKLLRSVLFCPGDREKVLHKAITLSCDAIIIDLEDAVGHMNKISARSQVLNFLKSYESKKPCIVRINCPQTTEWGNQDLLTFSNLETVSAILLPKVESCKSIEVVSSLIYESHGSHIPLWAMIETPRGVLNAPSIAEHNDIKCLVFGSNDLTKDIKAKHTPQREPLLYAMSHCILAARCADKLVIDGVHSNFLDMEGFRNSCFQGRNLGFDGKSLIHPSQINLTNELYSPSIEEIEFAGKVVKAWKEGTGVIKVEGKMIELLHYHEALDVLRFAEAAGILSDCDRALLI